MEYFLKHRDDIITVCDFDPDGNMRSWADRIADMDIAPLAYRTSPDWLKRWWNSSYSYFNNGNY